MEKKNTQFVDSQGNQHQMSHISIKDTLYFNAADILIMLGYKFNISKKKRKVAGLAAKNSPLSSIKSVIHGEEKYWNEDSLKSMLQLLKSVNRLKGKLDNWWKVTEYKLSIDTKPNFQEVIQTYIKEEPAVVKDNKYAVEEYELGCTPDTGSVCEYSVEGSPFRWCKITFMGSNVAVFETKTAPEVSVTLDRIDFRPIHSAKRESVDNMMKFASSGMKSIDFANRLYEAGYRLQEEK